MASDLVTERVGFPSAQQLLGAGQGPRRTADQSAT